MDNARANPPPYHRYDGLTDPALDTGTRAPMKPAPRSDRWCTRHTAVSRAGRLAPRPQRRGRPSTSPRVASVQRRPRGRHVGGWAMGAMGSVVVASGTRGRELRNGPGATSLGGPTVRGGARDPRSAGEDADCSHEQARRLFGPLGFSVLRRPSQRPARRTTVTAFPLSRHRLVSERGSPARHLVDCGLGRRRVMNAGVSVVGCRDHARASVVEGVQEPRRQVRGGLRGLRVGRGGATARCTSSRDNRAPRLRR
jgi:hypothetical protein